MGALPKRRISTGRKGRRRSAIKLRVVNLSACPNCNQPKRPHTACPNCGQYKGKDLTNKKKKGKKETRPKKSQS